LVRGESCLPWKRFSVFHSVCPCRMSQISFKS
jgi:hypothetical protein